MIIYSAKDVCWGAIGGYIVGTSVTKWWWGPPSNWNYVTAAIGILVILLSLVDRSTWERAAYRIIARFQR